MRHKCRMTAPAAGLNKLFLQKITSPQTFMVSLSEKNVYGLYFPLLILNDKCPVCLLEGPRFIFLYSG